MSSTSTPHSQGTQLLADSTGLQPLFLRPSCGSQILDFNTKGRHRTCPTCGGRGREGDVNNNAHATRDLQILHESTWRIPVDLWVRCVLFSSMYARVGGCSQKNSGDDSCFFVVCIIDTRCETKKNDGGITHLSCAINQSLSQYSLAWSCPAGFP